MGKTATITDAPAGHDRRERRFLGRAISARRGGRRLRTTDATEALAADAAAVWGDPQRRSGRIGEARSAAARDRAAAVPLDDATYACRCGEVFAAPVSTSVSCPRCGAAQAW